MSKDQKNNKRKFEENSLCSGNLKLQKTFHTYMNKRKLICISSNENVTNQIQKTKTCYNCEVHGNKDICDIYECSGINIIPKLNVNSYYN